MKFFSNTLPGQFISWTAWAILLFCAESWKAQYLAGVDVDPYIFCQVYTVYLCFYAFIFALVAGKLLDFLGIQRKVF